MTEAPSHTIPSLAPAAALVAVLQDWKSASAAQNALSHEYLNFLGSMDEPLARSGGPEHITASCFVFTPDLQSVLLCFHKKGQFWVQLGGHVESHDTTVAAAALREAHEEGGIADLRALGAQPVDLNRHGLGSSFGACRVHWDIGFAAIASAGSIPATSDESEDVAWWRVDELPHNVPPLFAERLATVLTHARDLRTP